jgi:hypothetical protein
LKSCFVTHRQTCQDLYALINIVSRSDGEVAEVIHRCADEDPDGLKGRMHKPIDLYEKPPTQQSRADHSIREPHALQLLSLQACLTVTLSESGKSQLWMTSCILLLYFHKHEASCHSSVLAKTSFGTVPCSEHSIDCESYCLLTQQNRLALSGERLSSVEFQSVPRMSLLRPASAQTPRGNGPKPPPSTRQRGLPEFVHAPR